MPLCPTCKTVLPAGLSQCPKDGSPLMTQAPPPLPLSKQAPVLHSAPIVPSVVQPAVLSEEAEDTNRRDTAEFESLAFDTMRVKLSDLPAMSAQPEDSDDSFSLSEEHTMQTEAIQISEFAVSSNQTNPGIAVIAEEDDLFEDHTAHQTADEVAEQAIQEIAEVPASQTILAKPSVPENMNTENNLRVPETTPQLAQTPSVVAVAPSPISAAPSGPPPLPMSPSGPPGRPPLPSHNLRASAKTPAEGTPVVGSTVRTPADGVPLVKASAKTPAEGTPVVGNSIRTPAEGTPLVGSSMRTPAEGVAVVGGDDGGRRPAGPPGRPIMPPMRAAAPIARAPLPPRPTGVSDPALATSRMSAQNLEIARPTPPKPDFLFPTAIDAADPKQDWALRVQSDAKEPGAIFMTTGGEDFAFCWHDRRQKRYELFGARIGLRGAKRGAAVSLSKSGTALSPTLAWDGSGYGLFWQDSRKSVSQIYYQHLNRELKPEGKEYCVTPADGNAMSPRVLWNGKEFVLSYAKQLGEVCEIYFVRVAQNGSILGKGEICVSESNSNAMNQDIIPFGEGYALAWEDFRNERGHIYFARLDPMGSPLTYNQRISVGRIGTSSAPSLAYNGSQVAVAWIEWPSDPREKNAIHFALVNTRGSRVGEIYRVVMERSIVAPLSLCWTGTEFLLSWQDSREGKPQIFVQRINSDGVRLSGEVRLSRGEEGSGYFPWAVETSHGIAAVWHHESYETGSNEIFASLVQIPTE